MSDSWKASGRSTVSTFVTVHNAPAVVEFARQVFGARLVRDPLMHDDGSLWHAELELGGSTIMIGEAPTDDMHRPAFLYVQVEDCDETYRMALEAGAESLMEPRDQFYGDRDGGVVDSAGNWWWIATHVENVSVDERERRARKIERERARD